MPNRRDPSSSVMRSGDDPAFEAEWLDVDDGQAELIGHRLDDCGTAFAVEVEMGIHGAAGPSPGMTPPVRASGT